MRALRRPSPLGSTCLLRRTPMIFVTAQPESLAVAAGRLQEIGSTLAAQNGATAAPTWQRSRRHLLSTGRAGRGVASPPKRRVSRRRWRTRLITTFYQRQALSTYPCSTNDSREVCRGFPAGRGGRAAARCQQISDGSRLWVYRSWHPVSRTRKDAAPR